ncbi:cytochrome P450 [Hypoxylon rubiginosum]|uniref:Cytochrome P450 n=1 Tax=Hypoxylon rubiginosum TaxID=110542 RepID=A0ACC0CUK9_9PEZI|nr:cytochrome P450 [Hypoxylon rubiginosum]
MELQITGLDFFTQTTSFSVIFGAVLFYSISRIIFLSYFHPLSRFPGPSIAAFSNIWYAYHWISGRYPWAIENALRKYGPVVRIAPNELAFFTPQAFTDIYSPHQKNLETFVKTNFQNRGKDLGGIIWEEDPVRHRQVARKLSPAFSSCSVRNMEPLVHKYMDYFIAKMKELGSDGIFLVQWTNWLAMDLSADLAWNAKMNQMRDMKDSIHLDTLLSFNKFATVLAVFKRFPLLTPFQYLFAPMGKVRLFAQMERVTRDSVLKRIDQRGSTEHDDYFEYILPADSPKPSDPRELLHIGSVALQVMFAGWGPMGDLFYGALALLLQEPNCYKALAEEVRTHFQDYESITPTELGSLPYLHACVEETLRMLPSNNTGLPRISPGATVDGHYVPKGAYVQSCIWALARSPTYFHDPLHFRPQRWLPPSHYLYDSAFAADHLKSLYPFSLGPRICLGREMAWVQAKLFLAKVFWAFDVVKVPNQDFDLDNTLLHYGFFEKPELKVRFVPIERDGE